MLWHVKDTRMHLLGSIHLLDSAPIVLSPQAERAAADAKRIVSEADTSLGFDRSITVLPEGDRLSYHISEDLFAATEELWLDLEMPDELGSLRPWWVMLRLMMTLAELLDITKEHGVETFILNAARTKGTEIVFLETPGATLKAFASAPPAEQEDSVSRMVNETAAAEAELREMISSWRAEKLPFFQRFLRKKLARFPLGYDWLIRRRNQAWMLKLVEMSRDGVPTLVVVGVLHFVGEHALPKLFKKAGIRVTRAD